MGFNTLVTIYICFAAFFYLIVHLGLLLGVKRSSGRSGTESPFISIVVAARNEERNITQLLKSLVRQTYSSYEIIIVNDRSSDKTASLIAEFQLEHPEIRRIDISMIPDDMPAKKNALRAGIAASKGEILCFTDADCIPPSTWLFELVRLFASNVGLVAGYSPYRSVLFKEGRKEFFLFKQIFLKFISYEEFRAAIWSSGSIGLRLGWLCTGRNLAYRRKVYDEVHGFEKIKMSISGDDDLFLQLVRSTTTWDIRYIQTRESFVPTVPPTGFWSFVEQRKRHFSAAKYFTLPMMLFFFFYHTSNLLLFLSPFLFWLNFIPLFVSIGAILVKLLSDALLIMPTSRIFNERSSRVPFIFMEVLYIFYNSLVGPLGFMRKFSWKQAEVK
jgi:cellulose synthase/poly-beta-1,6-N-acetylglucosamine synthase-like glycosyltransferase